MKSIMITKIHLPWSSKTPWRMHQLFQELTSELKHHVWQGTQDAVPSFLREVSNVMEEACRASRAQDGLLLRNHFMMSVYSVHALFTVLSGCCLYFKAKSKQAWWVTSVTSALESLRQKDHHQSEASVGYKVRTCAQRKKSYAWEMSQEVKCLYGDQSSGPTTYNHSGPRGWRQRTPQSMLTKLESSRFKWKTLPQHIRWRTIEEETQHQHMHIHTCTLTHRHMCTYMQILIFMCTYKKPNIESVPVKAQNLILVAVLQERNPYQ